AGLSLLRGGGRHAVRATGVVERAPHAAHRLVGPGARATVAMERAAHATRRLVYSPSMCPWVRTRALLVDHASLREALERERGVQRMRLIVRDRVRVHEA